ncbi:hypothetical protein [Paraburkholderia sp. CI3]|uniref:hypothetical protein n=1 Tax=Paraburkholderia sp. CI3 TaxID=2991060 RepID=UPI003D1DF6DE
MKSPGTQFARRFSWKPTRRQAARAVRLSKAHARHQGRLLPRKDTWTRPAHCHIEHPLLHLPDPVDRKLSGIEVSQRLVNLLVNFADRRDSVRISALGRKPQPMVGFEKMQGQLFVSYEQ